MLVADRVVGCPQPHAAVGVAGDEEAVRLKRVNFFSCAPRHRAVAVGACPRPVGGVGGGVVDKGVTGGLRGNR